MAREALLEINCSRYSERIVDIIKLFDEIGWRYYDSGKNIVYLPLGDDDNFDIIPRFQTKYFFLNSEYIRCYQNFLLILPSKLDNMNP